MRSKKKGFTLLEVMITLAITAMVFSLIYGIFHTTVLTSSRIMGNYGNLEKNINFLKIFSREIKSIFPEKEENFFSSESISFLTQKEFFPYPVKVNYEVKNTAEKKELWRKEENLLYEYTFCFPVITNADEIYFLFSDGKEWVKSWSKEKLPKGVGIFIKTGDFEFFYSVVLPENE